MKYSEWEKNEISGVGECRLVKVGPEEFSHIKLFRGDGEPLMLVRSRNGLEIAGPFELSREATLDLIAALIGLL